jgi:Undecaprenyl-phosphate glucose phosphotransferase
MSASTRHDDRANNLRDLDETAAAPQRPCSFVVIAGLVRLAELTIAAGAGVYGHQLSGGRAPVVACFVIAGLSAVFVTAGQGLGLYAFAALRAPGAVAARLLLAFALILASAGATLSALSDNPPFSPAGFAGWFGLGAALLAVERLFLASLTRALLRNGKLTRRVVLVGGGPLADAVIGALGAQTDGELTILGIFDDRDDERSPGSVAGYPKLGAVDDFLAFARQTHVDLVILTLPITAEARLLGMLRKLWVLPVDIRLAAHVNGLRFRPRAYSYIGDFPVIDVFDRPIADWDVVAKFVFDRIVGALCLMLAAPLMALIAIAIKLDSPGPILFRQARHGFNNRSVTIYKFRSMHVAQQDDRALAQVTRDDPRVTRVGRFIRRTSLDELPQLFNVVVTGELSLVGPRPHALIARSADIDYQQVVEGYFARHRVKPGVTGWAQINGWRGETDTPEKIQKRVEYDLYYIENWSIFFDLYIVAATPFALLRGENAY